MLTMRITGDGSNIMPSPQGGACIAIGTRQGTARIRIGTHPSTFSPFVGGFLEQEWGWNSEVLDLL